jgi:uncharacterized protein YjiS (DUF1127 family)
MINGSYFMRIGRGLERRAIAVLDAVFEYSERRRQRRQLAALDDRLLRDIGLSRADVERALRPERPWAGFRAPRLSTLFRSRRPRVGSATP